MTNRSELEQALDRYLAEGGEQVPDRVVDAALDQINRTSQRPAMRVPWRFPDMPYYLKSAMVGAAVVAVLLVGGILLTRGPTNDLPGGPEASTPASLVVSPSATPELTDTSNWLPFASERYGYEILYPPTWTATRATGEWDFETSRHNFQTTDADAFLGDDARVTAFASDLPAGMSEEEWIAAYYDGSIVEQVECAQFVDAQPTTVDGLPGFLAVTEECFDAQAFVFVGDRVHVFAIWRAGREDVLEAFLSTVEFQR